jgi:hypothetical protein
VPYTSTGWAMYPPNGSMFSAISGIVGLTFGGGILPTDPTDFTP